MGVAEALRLWEGCEGKTGKGGELQVPPTGELGQQGRSTGQGVQDLVLSSNLTNMLPWVSHVRINLVCWELHEPQT